VLREADQEARDAGDQVEGNDAGDHDGRVPYEASALRRHSLSVRRSGVQVDITIRDAGDLRRLNRDLRDVEDGKELQRELRTGLRGVLNPIREQVKAAYLAQPAYQGRRDRPGPPLRSLLAKATKTEVRTTGKLAGARLRVDGRKMPSGMRSLPAYWEGYKPRWRWPVYGNREAWAQGRARPIFDRTVGPIEDDARRAAEQVMEGVRRKLERG
jgi:hypothetical protein